jgi:hypothetical protein
MTGNEARQVAVTLVLMAETERAIGALYEACAKADADRGEVWRRVAAAERHHATGVGTMATILLRKKGEGFRVGRKFPPEAVRAFTDQVRKNEVDVKTGAIKGRVLYMIARGLETTLLEDRFYEFVATEDEAFRKLADRIVAETREHQTLMQAWVAAAGA